MQYFFFYFSDLCGFTSTSKNNHLLVPDFKKRIIILDTIKMFKSIKNTIFTIFIYNL